ncbi:MAG: hypothetical protein PHN88_04345 [Ignavibacteria bacterium]|nr:hypothetical protein [Ignavibacteria bacterium]
MKEEENNKTAGTELQELINYHPNWIIRWGISIVGLVVLLSLFLSDYIKTYEIVKTYKCRIENRVQRIKLPAQNTKAEILFKNGDYLEKGAYLVSLDTSANIQEILNLKKLLAVTEVYLQNPEYINLDLDAVKCNNPGFLRESLENMKTNLAELTTTMNKPGSREKPSIQKELVGISISSYHSLSEKFLQWETNNIIKSSISGYADIAEKSFRGNVRADTMEIFVNSDKGDQELSSIILEIDPNLKEKISVEQFLDLKLIIGADMYIINRCRIDSVVTYKEKNLMVVTATIPKQRKNDIPQYILERGIIDCSAEIVLNGQSMFKKIFYKYKEANRF